MEEQTNRNFHPDLHPILLEFHAINGQVLKAAWRVYEDGLLIQIVLGFESHSLILKAEGEFDTIAFQLIDNEALNTNGWRDASQCEPWSGLLGKPFGWGWIAINQQDFLDSVLLSFSGIIPQLMLNVMASQIIEIIIQPPFEGGPKLIPAFSDRR